MNKLSCAGALLTLAQDGLAVPSPMAHRQHLRMRVPTGTESSDGGTTPEAHTDGDNDSAFESDEDEKRGLPAPRRLLSKTSNRLLESCRWPCSKKSSVLQESLPRKQLGKLPVVASSTRLALVPNPWCSVQGRLERQALVPVASVGETGSNSPDSLQAGCKASTLKTERRQVIAGARAWMRAVRIATTSGAANHVPSKSTALGPNVTNEVGERKSEVIPLSPRDGNSPRCLGQKRSFSGNGQLPLHPTPSKKRKMPLPSPVPRPRVCNPCRDVSRKTQSSKLGSKERATKALTEKGGGLVAGDKIATSENEAAIDLSCNEVVDMDEVMNGSGEVRTPICRFLIPSWPEGVEGYEEIGGWRRLGGSNTPEPFPKGDKCS